MKSPIRILAIDGGGVGGIIPARVLERLHAAGLGIVDRADLVAGTSTGGLIALGLARGLTPEQLCQLYQQHAKDIFFQEESTLPGSPIDPGQVRPRWAQSGSPGDHRRPDAGPTPGEARLHPRDGR